MRHAKLPTVFRPFNTEHLIRLGRDNDGGYIIDSRDVDAADCLIALGINRDWSFERDFLSRKDVPLFAYDASVTKNILFKEIIKNMARVDKPQLFFGAVNTFIDYGNFFKGQRHHIVRFVGLDYKPTFVEMSVVFAEMNKGGLRRPFLKVDIEGSEYRILDQIIENASMLCGLTIEFHDCDIHLERIHDFIASLKLPLVHVHINNAGHMGKDNVPMLLELTFTSHSAGPDFADLPSALDMKNSPDADDFDITFTA